MTGCGEYLHMHETETRVSQSGAHSLTSVGLSSLLFAFLTTITLTPSVDFMTH